MKKLVLFWNEIQIDWVCCSVFIRYRCCLLFDIHGSLSCLNFGFSPFFTKTHEIRIKTIWYNVLPPSRFYYQSKQWVSVVETVQPKCSLKRSFFHLMICHKFMTRISSWIKIYFCCFTKISPLIAHTHTIHVIYMLERIHARNI